MQRGIVWLDCRRGTGGDVYGSGELQTLVTNRLNSDAYESDSERAMLPCIVFVLFLAHVTGREWGRA